MKTRIISGLILIPIVIFFLAKGGVYLQGAILFLSLVGMYEFYRAMHKTFQPLHLLGYGCALIYLIFAQFFINADNMFNILVSVFLVLLLAAMVIFHNRVMVQDIFVTFFGFFYVCFLLSHIYLVREYAYGQFFVWLIFISAFGCDTGAYFTGILFGKHKLIPSLSPKKTIEGAIGGVVVGTLLAVLFGLSVETMFQLDEVNTVLLCFVTGIVGSILSQIGDLAASAIKRSVGIKDYGTLIPGHGGVLDRFDSVMFTAPAVYYIMLFLIEVL